MNTDIVDVFARHMRSQFETNESIGGWRVIRPDNMPAYFAWLRENVDLLEKACVEGTPGDSGEDQLADIAAAAADVANLAAIIAQNAGALRKPPDMMTTEELSA